MTQATAKIEDTEKAQFFSSGDNFVGLDYAITQHMVTVQEGITPKDLTRPDFWAHIANRLRVHDVLYVRSEDSAFFGRLLVTDCGRTWAKVFILEMHDLTSESKSANDDDIVDGHSVKWKGPTKKFCVIRESDGAVIEEKCASKNDAFQRREAYLDTVNK